MTRFGEVVDSIGALRAEPQESLVVFMTPRLAEPRREASVEFVQKARKAFKTGRLRAASPVEIRGEVSA